MMVRDKDGLEEEAARFVRSLMPRAGSATVVALSGELGAGKTAFVKAAAKALGVDEHVTSPTFVIMKIYDLEGQAFKRLVHIDAYRLKGAHHLKVLGWDSLMSDPQNLIFMEWPEQAAAAIPSDAVRIALRYSGDHERTIDYEGSYKGTSETEEAVGSA
jgi:tRNA threonylcarbamoyladenosine biosynthesis protein TsaE